MNEEKLKQILKDIGQTEVPPNAAHIAEQASQRFADTLNILRAQRPPLATFFIGFKRVAVAASILFTFAIGLSVGRWSKPMPPASRLPEVASYTQPVSAYPTAGKNPDSFWQQKALAAMQPRPYSQNEISQTALLNVYKQYLKEKHYE
jgi:hypothetical protein